MDNLNQNPMATPKETKSWGPMIGLIVILALIIVGSVYFFLSEDKLSTSGEPSVADIENDLEKLRSQSESDELADIEADLRATNLSDLDAELDAAGRELDLITQGM